MRYVSFRVKNFRGIGDAIIDLVPRGAGIFTFIGLNESGKTTALEAISTFQLRGGDEKSLYQAKPAQIDPSSYVPKHEKATFSGEITVTATVEFEDGEKDLCIASTENIAGCTVDPKSVPNKFTIRRGYRYENGDKVEQINTWSITLMVKEKGKRKFSESITAADAPWAAFSNSVADRLPEIVYFPTFLFDQPDKIVLNPMSDELPVDKLYRLIIQNIGLSLSKPLDVKTTIVDRIITPETTGEVFAGLFGLSNNRQQQIDSAINQLSHQISTTVLGSWTRIFGGAKGNREIRLKLGVDKHPDGSPRVYVQFNIRDGVQPYDISERSLGFRWFFSFLLFTLFRGAGPGGRRTLFLLDEPASNLHAGAQIQLLDSFPRITKDGNLLMYSTHSHYMINPEWLDQAYIISNRAVDYDDLSSEIAEPQHTDIHAQKYRTFVGQNPDKPTYFQPVLDRLQVIPSRLDVLQPSVLVEGKGDYLVLKYGLFLLGKDETKFSIIPTRGADNFTELVGILLGWGVNFALCFDDDPKGRAACESYLKEWAVAPENAFTLADCDPSLRGKAIEGLLEKADIELIKSHYGITKNPTKSQIQLFFSEKLALRESVGLSLNFRNRIEGFFARSVSGLGIG